MVRHHVMVRLSKFFHVMWMNPALGWRELLQNRHRRSGNHQPPVAPGFGLYNPEPWLPIFYRPLWLGQRMAESRLKRARGGLLARGCEKIILYLWHPQFESALRCVPFDQSVYHIEDEYSFSPVELPMDPAEARLIRGVNRVFVLSPGLLEKKGRINPNTSYVPGGVDFALYARPAEEPADLAPIPRPRVGYSGYLKRQMDWKLLLELVRRHTALSFVFVGPQSPHPEIRAAIEEMRRMPNVYFLGPKSTHELAVYPQHFDVCIMPYVENDYTRYIYPLKLHEYLASGRPVVGTPLRSLQEFAQVVALPKNLPEWSAALALALAPAANSQPYRASRQRVARCYDWDLVVLQIARTVAQDLGPEFAERLEAGLGGVGKLKAIGAH